MNQYIRNAAADVIKAVKQLQILPIAEVFPEVSMQEHLFIDVALARELEIITPDDIVAYLKYEWADLVRSRLEGTVEAEDLEWRKYRIRKVVDILETEEIEYIDEGQYDDPDLEPLHPIREALKEMTYGIASQNPQRHESTSTE